MKDLLTYLTHGITGNSDITIEESEDTEGIKTYLIKAPKEVMGLLIGKQGKTIQAIRTLCKTRAIVEGTRISVQLEEAGS